MINQGPGNAWTMILTERIRSSIVGLILPKHNAELNSTLFWAKDCVPIIGRGRLRRIRPAERRAMEPSEKSLNCKGR